MNHLQICQMAVRESGTVSGTLPTSVAGNTGRLGRFVYWVSTAWTKIQNSKANWLWMRGEFDGELTAGTGRYTAASFNLARWAEWNTDPDTMTIYQTSVGVADEGPLRPIDWPVYRRKYERGTQVAGKPVEYTVSPQGELCFGPLPDANYIVRGEYQKSPQTLTENSDVPEMPARFHELIAWEAMLLMAEFDEAEFHTAVAERRATIMRSDLHRAQLPKIGIGGPLA